MTNEQIVMIERINAMKNGKIGTTGRMLTTEKGEQIPEPEELHTFQAWKELGYSVKKGEHATVTTKLWKKRTKKDDEDEKEYDGNFYLCKAFLFSPKQVEMRGA